MTIDYSKMPITEALLHFDNWPCLKIAEHESHYVLSMFKVPRPVAVMFANDPELYRQFINRIINGRIETAFYYLKEETGFGFSPYSNADFAKFERTKEPPVGAVMFHAPRDAITRDGDTIVAPTWRDKLRGILFRAGVKLGRLFSRLLALFRTASR